jgi:hypothetical protein
MRRSLTIFILCILPSAGYSHPGKTDLYGGHKCFKGCENWGLLYAEYHLHDKDGKPIRVAKKKAPRKLPVTRKAVDEVTLVTQEPMPETVAKPAPTSVSKAAVIPQREGFTLNPLLLILLALLLLLLLVRMRRRRLEHRKSG